jgi:hypothetical protein
MECGCKYNATVRVLPIPLVPPVINAFLPFSPNKVDKYDSMEEVVVGVAGEARRFWSSLNFVQTPGINFTNPPSKFPQAHYAHVQGKSFSMSMSIQVSSDPIPLLLF